MTDSCRKLGSIDRLQCLSGVEADQSHFGSQRIHILPKEFPQSSSVTQYRGRQDTASSQHCGRRIRETGRGRASGTSKVRVIPFFFLQTVTRLLTNCRARVTGRNRTFFTVPQRLDHNSCKDVVVNSVIAWSFYPKLAAREGKGWRNVMNNQTITVHPTSINRGCDASVQWLAYYHVMQARNRQNHAHETSAVESFAVALLCGEVDFKVHICPRGKILRTKRIQLTEDSSMRA